MPTVPSDRNDRCPNGAFVPPPADYPPFGDTVLTHLPILTRHTEALAVSPPIEICDSARRVGAAGADPLHGFRGEDVDAPATGARGGDEAHVPPTRGKFEGLGGALLVAEGGEGTRDFGDGTGGEGPGVEVATARGDEDTCLVWRVRGGSIWREGGAECGCM